MKSFTEHRTAGEFPLENTSYRRISISTDEYKMEDELFPRSGTLFNVFGNFNNTDSIVNHSTVQQKRRNYWHKNQIYRKEILRNVVLPLLCPRDHVTLDTYDLNIIEVISGDRECCELLLKVEKAMK